MSLIIKKNTTFKIPRTGSGAPSGVPLSTTNIDITWSGITRTLVKQSDTFWYNDRFGPGNESAPCETYRFSLRYQNSRWEFFQRFDYIDDGCFTGEEFLQETNVGSSSSIPTSNWSSITITAA